MLSGVISQRRRIVEETDKVDSENEDEDDAAAESETRLGSWRNPPGEAIAKFTDFRMSTEPCAGYVRN